MEGKPTETRDAQFDESGDQGGSDPQRKSGQRRKQTGRVGRTILIQLDSSDGTHSGHFRGATSYDPNDSNFKQNKKKNHSSTRS